MGYLQHEQLSQSARHRLRAQFEAADPCRHVVIDNFLHPESQQLDESFPGLAWDGWHRFGDAYQAEKVSYSNLDDMPEDLKQAFWELNGPSFLQFLQEISGIEALLADPYLKGGGLHCSGPGGTLTPHTDFHYYPELQVHRRLNVLIYLNQDWKSENGGALQLFADKRATEPVREIVPTWGRCVIFQTDHNSVHGFTSPIGPGLIRRSLATYYYTSAETANFSGDVSTYWRTHETADGLASRLQMMAYQGLLKSSKGLSIAAHRMNPSLRERK